MKFLTAILTSGNLRLLGRALNSVSSCDPEDVVIIVNTLDEEFVEELNRSEISTVYPIVRTESNGLPGKGHQSVLDYFLTTDATHLIKIDGDDFLLPDGHRGIRHTLLAKPDSDALGLVGERFRIPYQNGWLILHLGVVDQNTMIQDAGLPVTSDLLYWLHRLTSVSGTADTWFDRIVCYSRKGAELARYSETMPCVVDVQMNSALKLKAGDGELNYTQLYDPSIYLYEKKHSFGASSKFMHNPKEMLEMFFSRFTEEEQLRLEEYFLPLLVSNVDISNEEVTRIVEENDQLFELT